MTAACREACCSVTPRLTVSELFERGFRRSRAPELPIIGETCAGADDNTARFSIAISDGKLTELAFRASSCATLIAYCEQIAEIMPGFRIEIARELKPDDLVAALPGVPPLKHNRAVLAVAAFRAALAAAPIDNPRGR